MPTPSTSQRSFSHRISSLAPDEQAAKYEAISTRYGAPAYQPDQDIACAVCHRCQKKGHLVSKYPESQKEPRCPQPHALPAAQTPPGSFSCRSMSVNEEGSKILGSVVETDVSQIGPAAFTDSSSKIIVVTVALVSANLTPWTKSPLAVVGGGSVRSLGLCDLDMSVGEISARVTATVLENNMLPLILGEDWFEAAGAELHMRPPHPTEICKHKGTWS